MLFPVLWLVSAAVVAARPAKYAAYGLGGQTLFACAYYTSSSATFCADVEAYECFCTNQYAMASLAGCFGVEHRNTSQVYKYTANYCNTYYFTTLSKDDVHAAYDYYLANSVNSSDIPDFNATLPTNHTIKVDPELVKVYEASYKVFLGNYDNSLFYGGAAIGYWGLMAVIATFANWTSILIPSSRKFFNGTYSRLIRKYITLPALRQRKRMVSQRFGIFEFLVPSRLETLVVFLFFWLLFAFNAVDIYYVPNDPVFLDKKEALIRYMNDRTGIICTVLVPLLILFGGRNNFLQYLTGWNFTTMMVFHRWIARMVVVLAIIHSAGYTALYVLEGYYVEEMKAELYLQWGAAATICGALICFQGMLFLRRRWYETFLVLHIVLAVFFVIGLWYHVAELGYSEFVYACMAVWSFDRFIRLVRLASFGFPLAEVSLLADETIKVEVPRPSYWKPTAGGHAWLHFGSGLLFWQCHPFTFVNSVQKENTVVFYCKVKSGVTKSIYNKLVNVPGKKTTIRVAVEGPYGKPSPVSKHSSAVFVAGGSGIPGIYSEVERLANSNIPVLKLFWILREVKSVAWFSDELQALKDTKVQTTIYITRPEVDLVETSSQEGSQEESQEDNEKKEDFEKGLNFLERAQRQFPHIEFKAGRPDLGQLVESEVSECTSSVAFTTCGHPVLVDDLRYRVVQQLDRTEKRVDFFEQLQIWA